MNQNFSNLELKNTINPLSPKGGGGDFHPLQKLRFSKADFSDFLS